MKKKTLCILGIVALVVIFLFATRVLTGRKGEQAFFNAKVLEVTENRVFVEPVGDFWETAYSSIWVTLETVSPTVPEISVGDTIRIIYNGAVQESYPPQINHVFSIFMVDESGNVLPH